MEKQKLLTKIKLFYKEKIDPNGLVISSVCLSITLLTVFVKFVKSLEKTGFDLITKSWLITFIIGFGCLLFTFVRLGLFYTKSHSTLVQSLAFAKDITQKLIGAMQMPRNPQFLIEKFLSIKSVLIFYVDDKRVNNLYIKVVGGKQLQTVTEEWVGEQGTGFSVGYKDIIRGDMSDKSTRKLSGISQVQDPGIEEKFLTVQSSLLRLDSVAVGYEHSLCQIENDLNETDFDDYDKWFLKEVQRLLTLSGLILLDAEFLVQEFDSPKNIYQFTFARPMVNNTVTSPILEFRITIAKDLFQVNEQLLLNNHIGKKVKFHVFGHVSAKSEGKTDKDKVVDILPLVIYQQL